MSEKEIEKTVEILLVEDNEGDIFLTKKAFSKAKILNNIQVVKNGEDAIKSLKKEGEFANAKRPDIIFLDINLPKKNGKEVLAEIKADEKLKRIPVVILSSSKAEQDILKTYDLYANSYIVKPVNTEQFCKIVEAIEEFWFKVVILPQDRDE